MTGTTLKEAHALHRDGQLDAAVAAYREILDGEPDSFKAHNNLGSVLEDQGELEEAAACYKSALALDSSHALIHYNLGHVLQAQEKVNDAAASYRAALELEPGHLKCQLNLGMIRHQQGRLDSAIKWYSEVTSNAPEFAKGYEYLGKALFDKGLISEALEAHQCRVRLDADDDAAHFSVGHCLCVLGKLEEAKQSFERALTLRPMSSTYENLARVLQQMGKHDEAIATYERWLAAEPDNPSARHMLTAATGADVPVRAPGEYVKGLFDTFSADFDTTLNRLGYRGPQIIAAAMGRAFPTAAGALRILDAGCGTGLCGPLLRDYAERLVGVDLSGGMLAKARERGCYDELVAADLMEFLTGSERGAYDVIVCADTLIYFGDLEPVFSAAAAALDPSGMLIFTTETLPDEPSEQEKYRLNAHGRYSHARHHVREALGHAGLSIGEMESEPLRKEGQAPVVGLLVTARSGVSSG